MELNFNKVEKHYLRITLFNEKAPILVGTPNKKLLDKIMAMDNVLKVKDDADLNDEQISDLYRISAEILSVNKTNRKISNKDLESMFDIEDLLLFFNTYMDFLDSVVNLKN